MADVSPHGLAPEEAIAYFKAKGLHLEPTFDWRDMWQESHGSAFTIAKSAGFDILGDVHAACLKNLEEGRTLRQFSEELMPTLAAKGWWGRKKMVDPVTGEEREVQLGSPRRLRTIYDVNLRTAQSAGAWRHIESTKKRRPWLRYVAILDSRTRPDHKDWHGTVLPVDDPWWETHFPPNGWRCRCTVQQLSGHDLEDFGFTPSPTAPPAPLLPWTNERTGETILTPAGVDPGFAYHIGKAGQSGRSARVAMGKLVTLPPELGAEAGKALRPVTPQVERELGEWIEGISKKAAEDGKFKATGERRIVGCIDSDILTWLKKNARVEPQTAAISISDKDILHLQRSSKRARGHALSLEDMRRLPSFLQKPEAIYWDQGVSATGGQKREPALIYLFDAGKDDKGKLIIRIDVMEKQRNPQTGKRSTIQTNAVRSGRVGIKDEDLNEGDGYFRIR